MLGAVPATGLWADRIRIAMPSIFIYATARLKLHQNRELGLCRVAQVPRRVDLYRDTGYDAWHRYLVA